MRLLMLSDARNPHTIRWVNALADRGIRILLYSLQTPNPADYSVRTGLEIESLHLSSSVVRGAHNSIRKLRYFAAVPQLRGLARSFVPDISNAHFVSSYGILGTMAGLRPLLVSVWGTDVYDAPEQNAVMRTAIRYVLQRADRVLSTSRVMSEATRLLVQREVAITPFGVDTVRFAPDEGRAMCAPITRIGIVKALEKKYGVDVLLRAFRHVLNQRPGKGIELTVVGDGSQRSSLEDLSKELGIEGRTRFVGRVPYDRVHKMHQSFDIAVYPSVDRSETFGVSAVESQACGVPVVASNIGGLAEVVLDGSTGILVPPGDPAALAKAIGLLVDRPDIRQDYGAAARAHVLGSYSLDLSVDLMIKQYELALGARS